MAAEPNKPRYTSKEIQRNDVVTPLEIEDLRAAVGWERLENKYEKILANSYTHFTLRKDNRLVGFVNVISDGICDAFLVDLIVHPSAQRRGIARALVDAAIAALTADGIKCIQVTFDPELESFYRDCGFHIFRGGIIDTDERR
jgi:ribosomal protein S18 acetylase RimI-like enzyme